MKIPSNYTDINRESWNNRLESHLNSEFYNLEAFINGKSSLNSIELELLGNIKGKSILHLQCHFGQDSISLSRMGAKVTGVDLSDKSIEKAKEIASQCGEAIHFINSNVYDLKNKLHKKYDIVFTSYGTISWLPDLDKWASIINHFLKDNGKFIFVEFHPFIWMYDDDLNFIKYNYFNRELIIEEEQGTYADRDANIQQSYVCFNHGLSEVMGALKSTGLQIRDFKEYDFSPYSIFEDMEEFEESKYRIKKFENKVPLVYSLIADN